MRRSASSASKGSHRRQLRRILKETALIYPKIIMVIIVQPHRWDKTLRWREGDSNRWSLPRTSRNGNAAGGLKSVVNAGADRGSNLSSAVSESTHRSAGGSAVHMPSFGRRRPLG